MAGRRLVVALALVAGLALGAAGCSNGDDPASIDGTPEADDGQAAARSPDTRGSVPQPETAPEQQDEDVPAVAEGFVVWVHEQEPPDLHLDDPNNNLTITSWIRRALLEGLFGISVDIDHYPELLSAEPRLTVDDDRRVTIDYTLRDGLTWSDGTPLTAADVEYTHRIITEGCDTEADGSILDGSSEGCRYLMGDRTGYDLVTGFEVTSDTQFTISMASFFAGWRGLYDEVFAAHAFGEDAAAVNANLAGWRGPGGVLPSAGPLVFDGWEPGVAMRLVRNDAYHGSTSPDARNRGVASIEGVQISFVADDDAMIEAVLAGEAQLMFTQAELGFERLVESDDFEVAATAGSTFEHWGLNLLNTHLAKPEVREALAHALDKGAVVAALYEPLFGTALPPEGLGNTYWMATQAHYEDHQAGYAGGNVDEARRLLESAGYVPGGDGVYRHPVDGRLSLRVGTTGGNALREQEQQLIAEQLAEAGIEIVIDNVAGGAYFRERPFAESALAASVSGGAEGDPTIWDITQFAWVGGPWPGGQSGSYRGGSINNPYGFDSPEFDARASECDAMVDDGERAGCYNELDTYVTTLERGDDGLFMLPLTQKASFYGYRTDQVAAVGVAPDTDDGGPLVNVVDIELR